MKRLFVALIFYAAGAIAEVIDYLPPPDFAPGWTHEFAPQVYEADNLHEYINGQAELYQRYDVVEVATAAYVLTENPAFTFTIDIYDMGSALNAFGIYSVFRQPDMTFADIGEQATVSDMSVRFWQGEFFVQIIAGAVDSVLSQTVRDVAQQVSATLPLAPRPAIFNLLPDESQILNSLKFLKSTYLGVKNVTALEAQFDYQGEKNTVFILFFKNEKIVREFLAQTRHYRDVRLKTIGNTVYGVKDFGNDTTAAYFLEQLP